MMKKDVFSKRAVCTIVAKNYLALAKTLADSIRKFHPDIDFHLLVVDRSGLPQGEINHETITLVDPLELMSAEQYNRMAADYDITEFSTALKPFALRYLVELGYEQVFYFDPDILVVRPIDGITAALEDANIVLTPHLLDPIPMDGLLPNEMFIMMAGTYNLGFIGIKASQETLRFLDWWAERLDRLCKIAIPEGLFVDQKWIDLVPGMFAGVAILKDPGFNVAYWNVYARRLSMVDGKYYVGDQQAPLIFYHFSGYDTRKPKSLSRHQNRVDLDHEPALSELLGHYAELLEANGHSRYKTLHYTPGVPQGINVAGYLTAELGVGEAARGYIASLRRPGIGLALMDFAKGTPSRKADPSLSGFSSENPYPINLICVNADQVEHFIGHAGVKYIKEKINIGVWWWELPIFPEIWKGSFRYFDEIWVGSEFARQAVQAVSPVPVVRIPPVVEVRLDRKYPREHFGLDPSEYVFLFIFDFLSIFERKNPLATVRAFKAAFRRTEPVRLVLKCINESHDLEGLSRLEEEIGDARVTLMKGYLSKDEKNGLIETADCYVSLHRSEGFGYTLAEAMYVGKPVIATKWSGNMDFMTEENSYPVNCKLVELDRDYGPYKRGQVWADPDISHASAIMRRVYEIPNEAAAKGVRAAKGIRAMHSVPAVASAIWEQLYTLPLNARVKAKQHPNKFMMAVFSSPHVRRLMMVAKRCVPARIGIAVKKYVSNAGWY